MNLLYVTTTTDLGGAEKALLSLVRAMAKENTVKVVSLKPAGVLAPLLEKAGAQVVSLNMKRWGVGLLPALRKEIRAFKPAFIHAILFRGMELTRLACWKDTIPLVTTPHFDLSKKPFLLRLLDRFLRRRDTYTVAESESTQNYLLSAQKYPKEKIRLILNSPEEGKFFRDPQRRAQMRMENGYLAEQIIFLNVARLEKVKNPIFLLKSFLTVYQQNPNVRLILVGQGALKSAVQAFITENKLQNAVKLAGEKQNINDWLNLADVFVLPSEEESLPLSLLEALKAGKPCIVTQVGDMPVWVEPGQNGFVVPSGNEKELSKALLKISLEPALRREMGENSLKKAAGIKDSILEYQKLYHQILEESFHVKTLK